MAKANTPGGVDTACENTPTSRTEKRRRAAAVQTIQPTSFVRINVDGYDEAADLAVAASLSPLPGAKRLPLIALSQAAQLLVDYPEAAVVVSDVHGDLPRLDNLLRGLGMVDNNSQRIQGRGKAIQSGDLVDGRDPQDQETLQYGAEVFEHILVGNHEAALLGGKTFGGLLIVDPEVKRGLDRAINMGQMDAAIVAHGVLLTHAGVNNQLLEADSAEQAAAAVNDEFYEFYGRMHQSGLLFDNSAARGGSAAHGGVLWQDFTELLQPGNASEHYRQIVGHTPLGGPEGNGQVAGIDCKGPRLGAAIILPDGSIHYTSDRLSI